MNITDEQREALKKLWWIYGNNGKKCTLFNHKLIQGYYHYNEDRLEDYIQGNKNMLERWGDDYVKEKGITQDCVDAVCNLFNKPKITLSN